MIRNDGKSFETKGRISIDPELDMENLSALSWYYTHTGCIVSGYDILRLMVLMARKENHYLAPASFYNSIGERGYFTESFLSDIEPVLDDVFNNMRKHDPGLDEEMHLSGEYEDEAKKIKKILKVQMNQEFIYAVKDCCPSSAPKRLEVYDDSVMFDWRPLFRHFLDETDLREYEFGIVKHGYDLSVKHLGDVLAGNHDGQRSADPLVVKYLTSGRTVYSLLSDAGYHWNRVLQHIGWIRGRERQRTKHYSALTVEGITE